MGHISAVLSGRPERGTPFGREVGRKIFDPIREVYTCILFKWHLGLYFSGQPWAAYQAEKNSFELPSRTLVKTIKYLGEGGIYKKTGCKSNCEVNRYKLEKRYKLTSYMDTDKVKYTS